MYIEYDLTFDTHAHGYSGTILANKSQIILGPIRLLIRNASVYASLSVAAYASIFVSVHVYLLWVRTHPPARSLLYFLILPLTAPVNRAQTLEAIRDSRDLRSNLRSQCEKGCVCIDTLACIHTIMVKNFIFHYIQQEYIVFI